MFVFVTTFKYISITYSSDQTPNPESTILIFSTKFAVCSDLLKMNFRVSKLTKSAHYQITNSSKKPICSSLKVSKVSIFMNKVVSGCGV